MARIGLRTACSSEPVLGSTVHIGLGTGVGRTDGVDVRGTEILAGAGDGMVAEAGVTAAVMTMDMGVDTLDADTATVDFMARQDFMAADTILLPATALGAATMEVADSTAEAATMAAAGSTAEVASTEVVDSMAADADNSDQA